MFFTDYIKDIFRSVKSLLTGMRMTGYYFMHPRKEIITQQYPEAVPQLPDRFKGEVVLIHDENNEHALHRLHRL